MIVTYTNEKSMADEFLHLTVINHLTDGNPHTAAYIVAETDVPNVISRFMFAISLPSGATYFRSLIPRQDTRSRDGRRAGGVGVNL